MPYFTRSKGRRRRLACLEALCEALLSLLSATCAPAFPHPPHSLRAARKASATYRKMPRRRRSPLRASAAATAPRRLLQQLVLLAAAAAAAHAAVKDGHADPSPATFELPNGGPAGCCARPGGSYSVPDLDDVTSYYVCCGSSAVVRRTCQFLETDTGVYQPLVPARYQPATGLCVDAPANTTSGSFRATASSGGAASSSPLLSSLRYSMAPAAFTPLAAAACKGASTPADAAAVGSLAATTVRAMGLALPDAMLRGRAEDGEWTLIRNSKGASSTGVVAINAVLLPESDKVLFWARRHMDGSGGYEPGVVAGDGAPEQATVFDTQTGEYVVKRMRLTPFCTGQSHMPDGTPLLAGGDEDVQLPGYTDGRRGIRLYERGPGGDWSQGSFDIVAPLGLRKPRWYPTQTLVGSSRVLITGGTVAMFNATPVPSVEVYDIAQRRVVKETTLPLLEDLRNFILYPLVYVLPRSSGGGASQTRLFMFNCDRGAIMDLDSANEWRQVSKLPVRKSATTGWPSEGYCGAMSMAGTATMLMLDYRNNYAAEVVMFGGFRKARAQCPCDTPTLDKAHRIKLGQAAIENGGLQWEREQMPYGRNLNDAVLLPDGKVLVVNGAKSGVIGNARDAALDAWMYDPAAPAGQRFTVLASSGIRRYYHSVALLLPDASVLVAGSEYGECTQGCARRTPWLFQHQAERFRPPYFFSGRRPAITRLSARRLSYGASVSVDFTGTATHAVLMSPAAVSHQVNSNQRGVRLAVISRVASEGGGRVMVRLPPNPHVIQPGWHLLFVMNGGLPCTKAAWVNLA